ncbi:acetolactate synthase large subunit [Tropicimonas sp. IMCC34043]|uniref:acetolactate synthase large subunit n=1 Tax=Tropicimonas sp. IMCC34043 TaxID=2248760 RepID=UPI000E260285|nr:acetolactate synthase large subunit [Tropicimonas sp. IMCC34043]
MNGAESLVKTLLAGDVDVCFANPGTSEMHFVAALDLHPEMRCILTLFEGGATGAADGYFRMTGRLAATLLHLAPGFGNGYANLHNARKAHSAVLNIVGDHADYHLRYDAPLKGDIAGVTRSVSHWVRSSTDAASVAWDGADAIRAAMSGNGRIATLVLPANAAWDKAKGIASSRAPVPPQRPSKTLVAAAAAALWRPGAALFVGGAALYGDLSRVAGQIAARTGCRLMSDYFVPRIERGAGAVDIECLHYPVLENAAILKDVSEIVLLGAGRPVAFFAYPDKPSTPEPAGCPILDLCAPDMDIAWTLKALADLTGAEAVEPALLSLDLPELPQGAMSIENLGQALAALLPEDAVVVNESVTAGQPLADATRHARRHDWLNNPGGAIGEALPLAVGAAVGCPDRKVVVLTGDGSAMYTLQALWTMAREELDVTVVVLANRGYKILWGELANVGVEKPGETAAQMFDLTDPVLDWVSLARGHGVPAARAVDMSQFIAALREGLDRPGPYLIEAVC